MIKRIPAFLICPATPHPLLTPFMPNFRLAPLLLLTLLMTLACVQPAAKTLSPADRAHTLLQRTLADQSVRDIFAQNQRTLPSHTWNLDDLTLAAFALQPDMALARAQLHAAQAGTHTAAQRPNPTFSFTPERITNVTSGLSPWIHTFNLTLPLETAGKRKLRIRQATATAQAAEFGVATTAWNIRARLATALLNLATWTEKLTALHLQSANLAHYHATLQQRIAANMLSPRQLTDTQLLRDQSDTTLADAQTQQHQALADVATALALPLAGLETLHVDFGSLLHESAITRMSLPDLQQRALTNRPDILAGVADYAACQNALQLELAKRYPDINLGPGYQWSQGEHHWSLGFTITLPIFNRNAGGIAEAKVRCETLSAQFNQLQAHIVADLDHAWARYHDTQRTVDAARSQLAHLEQKLSQLTGDHPNADVIQSALIATEQNRTAAQLQVADAAHQLAQARLDLENILQRPLDTDRPSAMHAHAWADPVSPEHVR